MSYDPNQPQQQMTPYQGMGQPQPIQYMQVPMIQTPQGWVPYQQGMGQVAPAAPVAAPAPAQQPGMKMGSALITLAVVGFGIKMLYDWAKDREGGSGEGSREDYVTERQQRRSKSRMVAEFERYLDTHQVHERAHTRDRGFHDVREEARDDARDDAHEDAHEDHEAHED